VGLNNPAYIISSATGADAGLYRVEISDNETTLISDSVILLVNENAVPASSQLLLLLTVLLINVSTGLVLLKRNKG
jgi:hypothetical protein